MVPAHLRHLVIGAVLGSIAGCGCWDTRYEEYVEFCSKNPCSGTTGGSGPSGGPGGAPGGGLGGGAAGGTAGGAAGGTAGGAAGGTAGGAAGGPAGGSAGGTAGGGDVDGGEVDGGDVDGGDVHISFGPLPDTETGTCLATSLTFRNELFQPINSPDASVMLFASAGVTFYPFPNCSGGPAVVLPTNGSAMLDIGITSAHFGKKDVAASLTGFRSASGFFLSTAELQFRSDAYVSNACGVNDKLELVANSNAVGGPVTAGDSIVPVLVVTTDGGTLAVGMADSMCTVDAATGLVFPSFGVNLMTPLYVSWAAPNGTQAELIAAPSSPNSGLFTVIKNIVSVYAACFPTGHACNVGTDCCSNGCGATCQ